MANSEQLEIFRKGATEWNAWREINPVRPILSYEKFDGLDFAGFNLKSCDLTSSSFSNCIFTDSTLEFVHLNSCRFENCDFNGASIATSFFNNSTFRKSNLDNARFYLTELENASFSDCSLKKTIFENIEFKKTTFDFSDYRQTDFWNTPSIFRMRDPLNPDFSETIKHIESIISGYFNTLINVTPNDRLYYRGESKIDYVLSPMIFREPNWASREPEMMTALMTERPEAFQSRSHFGNMVVARHHGLPNRLLDITRNPLVALFYACNSNPSEQDCDGKLHIFVANPSMIKDFNSDTISILANFSRLNQEEKRAILGLYYSVEPAKNKLLHFIGEEKPHFQERINYGDLIRPFIVEPQKTIERVRAQAGAFLISATHHRFERDEILKETPHAPCYGYQSVTIPKDAKKQILQELAALNVTEDTLMADLDHYAKAIKERTQKA